MFTGPVPSPGIGIGFGSEVGFSTRYSSTGAPIDAAAAMSAAFTFDASNFAAASSILPIRRLEVRLHRLSRLGLHEAQRVKRDTTTGFR